jgi:hypothetical protein
MSANVMGTLLAGDVQIGHEKPQSIEYSWVCNALDVTDRSYISIVIEVDYVARGTDFSSNGFLSPNP